jgi:oligopeptidase B
MGACLNMRPDLCHVWLGVVPFVNPIETLTTYKTPLGLESQSELGNPEDPKVRKYIESYAPLNNIQSNGTYPNMFIYTNLNDSLVPYKEPIGYYKKMKELECYKSGKRDISFYLDLRYGHTQSSELSGKCLHYAMLFEYVLRFIQ